MSWLKIDDSFTEHPKVLLLTDTALAFWVKVACWLQRNPKFGGFIPSVLLPDITRKTPEEAAELATQLVNARAGGLYETGLWVECDGGFRVHDWDEYQPSQEAVEQRRTVRAEAGRLGGIRSGERRREATGKQTRSKTQARASRLLEQNGSKPEANANPDPDPDPDPITSKDDQVVAKDLTGSAGGRAEEPPPPPDSRIVSSPPRVRNSMTVPSAQPRGAQREQSGISDASVVALGKSPWHDPHQVHPRSAGVPPLPRRDIACAMVGRAEYHPGENQLAYAHEKGLTDLAIEETLSELRNDSGGKSRTIDRWDGLWVRFVDARARRNANGKHRGHQQLKPGDAGYRRQPDAGLDFSVYELQPEPAEVANG